jgi:hypothetical protein
MYGAHPNSSQSPHQAKTSLHLTHSIITNVFTKGKERKKNINKQQQHQNAVIVATGFVHFVSYEMNECSLTEYQMLTYFDEFAFPGFTISSSCHSLLVLSALN